MDWVKRAAANLLPLSEEKNSFPLALKEWLYHGENYDLESPTGVCELCDYENIRYRFAIDNKFNIMKLLIGSECITKFGIGVTDEFNNVLDETEGTRKLQKDRRKLITNAMLKRVINSLIELGKADAYFSKNLESFINYYNSRDGFTPNQLLLVLKKFKIFKIRYFKKDFKLKLRRNTERIQLLKMSKNDFGIVWECFSAAQKNRYLHLKEIRD